jgi:hypothetical protein
MKKSHDKKSRRRKEVVLLRDLAPREDVVGGSGQILFGQTIHPPGDAPKKDRSQT